MKSQSTIIGRVFPATSTIKTRARHVLHSVRDAGDTGFIIIFTVTITVSLCLLCILVAQSSARNLSRQAQIHHYNVGSTVMCNTNDDNINDDSGWVPCKILSISTDNKHYTASFISPSENTRIIFAFPITGVSQP